MLCRCSGYVGGGLLWTVIWGGVKWTMGIKFQLHINFDLRRKMTFYTAGITILTLLINGSFIKPIYQSLSIYKHTRSNASHVRTMLIKAETELESHILMQMHKHWMFMW